MQFKLKWVEKPVPLLENASFSSGSRTDSWFSLIISVCVLSCITLLGNREVMQKTNVHISRNVTFHIFCPVYLNVCIMSVLSQGCRKCISLAIFKKKINSGSCRFSQLKTWCCLCYSYSMVLKVCTADHQECEGTCYNYQEYCLTQGGGVECKRCCISVFNWLIVVHLKHLI